MKTYTQQAEKQTKENKAAWLVWFKTYSAAKFLDAFLRTVENAESVCVQCHQPIYVDVLIGGGTPDWSTEDGDFGCVGSPDTTTDCTGSHAPRKRT